MDDLGILVARYLPDTLGYRPAPTTWPGQAFTLAGPEGRCICARQYGPRLQITGEYAKNKEGEEVIGSYHNPPCITVSLARGPQSIARDIHRRFLPAYEELFRKSLDFAQADNRRIDQTEALVAGLEKALGVERDRRQNHQGKLHLHRPPAVYYGDFKVNGPESVDIKLAVDGPTALKLARAIRRVLKGSQ